jgi:DUF1365 family protein
VSTATTDAGLFEGTVWHHRSEPDHGFERRVTMAYVNLDHLDEVFGVSRLLGDHWLAPAKLKREDFFGDPHIPLSECVRDLVERELGFRPDGDVCMLANLRTWGWCFNPIVIFWCFDTYGRPVAQVLGVTNTPWHEYHNYVLDLRGEPATSTLRKVHHVSPFFPMDLTYQVDSTLTSDSLWFKLDVLQGSTVIFTAGLNAARRPLSARELRRLLVRHPTQRVSIGIYVQALRLWRKGARFQPHPKRSAPIPREETVA